MEKLLHGIEQAFCEDCHARMQQVADIVRAGLPLSNGQLDQLHQEFDTLFGGARAVHLPDLERYFCTMAIYARYLRNQQMVGQEVVTSDWQRLLSGIAMGQCCGGALFLCLKPCSSEHPLLLDDIENRINKGEGK
jgi:hypothetical protein